MNKSVLVPSSISFTPTYSNPRTKMKLFPSSLARNTCVGCVGTLLLSSGVIVILLWTWLFDFIIASMLVLKPNSQTLDVWRKPPMPIYLDFYFFNWTNPEEIHDLTKKPMFKEVGPYRFREHREKVNLTWNANHTITFRQLRYWYFDEEHSVGKLSDEVTTLNAVTMSAANQVRNWSYFMKKAFSISLTAIAPVVHITKPVGQLLFEGYHDPYVDIALSVPFMADTLPPFDKFGWFYTRNESYTFDGIFNMATGEGGNNIGELLRWNDYSETPFFKGSCAKVHGSAAELYPQSRSRDHIGFFSPDMCRHVRLDYEEDVTVKGIHGYKYSAQHGMLDNGTILPENKCYCDGECVPSGLLNVSSCRYGTPSFVSLPHFYGADPVYLEKVDGLRPEKSKHEVFIALEPRTGVPLNVSVRLQLNLMMFPIQHITLYEQVPKVFFPMLWFEQKASLPDDFVFQMKVLQNAPTIFAVFGWSLIGIGISLFLYIGRKLITELYHNPKQKPVLCQEQVPLNSIKEKDHRLSIVRKPSLMELIYS